MSIIKTVATAKVAHIPKFGGNIWYIDKVNGSNNNSGKSPDRAFETIGTGITAMANGDALNVKAGTYTEESLNLSNDAAEMWLEIGAILDPAANTALTISGNYCKVVGNHKITPGAGEIGILVTGDECIVEDSKILNGATGIRVTGSGVILNRCVAGFQTTTAYDLQGIQGRLYRCKTVGNSTTYGYRVNNNVDTGVIEHCTSAGHQTSGFFISSGSQDWTLLNCSSGGGDGRWIDEDHANVWSNFTYDNEIHKIITFSGATTEYNMFKITGAVRINDIFGTVETVIPNTTSTIHLEIYSTNGTVDITDAPGTDLDSAVVGAIMVRNGVSTTALDLANPDSTPAIAENVSFRDPRTGIDIVEDDSADTWVRLVLSAALASGVIDWHCNWEPLSDNGFLEAA